MTTRIGLVVDGEQVVSCIATWRIRIAIGKTGVQGAIDEEVRSISPVAP